LKLECDELLSNVGFKFSLRRYTVVRVGGAERERGEEAVHRGYAEGRGRPNSRLIVATPPAILTLGSDAGKGK